MQGVKIMREILFRGKRTDNGEWVYGSFIPDLLESLNGQKVDWGFIKPISKEKEKKVMLKVYRKSVGQYTGLTDKNGKKIFEGDILETNSGSRGYVVFVNGNFARLHNQKWEWETIMIISDANVVIGNIHDNPALLEQKP